jgi:inorganic triphosphatase YgiF
MTTDDREIEWQFEAVDLQAVRDWLDRVAAQTGHEGVEAAESGIVDHVDVYLDTDDRRFQRAGYALRLRRVEEQAGGEATLKGLDPVSADAPGLRSRPEITEQLDEPDPQSVLTAPGVVGERVRAVLGGKPLVELFKVRTHRRTFALTTAAVAAGELALDETAIEVPARDEAVHLRRVEIEVPESAVATVEPFVDSLREACSLQPAALSKYEVGMKAAGP